MTIWLCTVRNTSSLSSLGSQARPGKPFSLVGDLIKVGHFKAFVQQLILIFAVEFLAGKCRLAHLDKSFYSARLLVYVFV